MKETVIGDNYKRDKPFYNIIVTLFYNFTSSNNEGIYKNKTLIHKDLMHIKVINSLKTYR